MLFICPPHAHISPWLMARRDNEIGTGGDGALDPTGTLD